VKKSDNNTDLKKKWEVHYEDDETYDIWSYDSSISRVNPVSVEILFKNDRTDKKKIDKLKNK
jgi:hypothetical protein